MLASTLLRNACLYENVGFPYLVESIAPLQVEILLCMNNMTSHWLPNHSIGLTFDRVSVFFFFFLLGESIGFPYLIEGIAPPHVGVLPRLNNMIVRRLPNIS